jgi:hypothetical protein
MKIYQKLIHMTGNVFLAALTLNCFACSQAMSAQNGKAPEIEFKIRKQSLDHGPIRMRLLPIYSSSEIVVLAGKIWIHCPGYEVAKNFSEGRYALSDGCIVEITNGASCKIIVGKQADEIRIPTNSPNIWLKFVAPEKP